MQLFLYPTQNGPIIVEKHMNSMWIEGDPEQWVDLQVLLQHARWSASVRLCVDWWLLGTVGDKCRGVICSSDKLNCPIYYWIGEFNFSFGGLTCSLATFHDFIVPVMDFLRFCTIQLCTCVPRFVCVPHRRRKADVRSPNFCLLETVFVYGCVSTVDLIVG